MSAVSSLRDMQAQIGAQLLGEGPGAVADFIAGDPRSAAARFGVYQNNVLASLRKALADSYPIVAALVGEAFFKRVAHAYIRAHPPRVRMLADYGRDFGDFLDGFAPARSHPYLGDVARLERAVEDAYLAAEATPLSPQALATLPSDSFGRLRLTLHPSRQFVTSKYPVVAVWREAKKPDAEQTRIDLSAGPSYALVIRPHAHVSVVDLTAGGMALIRALDAGATLADAVESALQHEDDFNVQACLQTALQNDAFVAFALDDTELNA